MTYIIIINYPIFIIPFIPIYPDMYSWLFAGEISTVGQHISTWPQPPGPRAESCHRPSPVKRTSHDCGFSILKRFVGETCIYGPVLRLSTPPLPPPMGWVPFPSICKLLAAFLRSSFVFARSLQHF